MEDKVVIVTGASSGIGAAIAKHFASIGYKKLAITARRKERLEEVIKLIDAEIINLMEGCFR